MTYMLLVETYTYTLKDAKVIQWGKIAFSTTEETGTHTLLLLVLQLLDCLTVNVKYALILLPFTSCKNAACKENTALHSFSLCPIFLSSLFLLLLHLLKKC